MLLYLLLIPMLLLNADLVMQSVRVSCHLFVTSVLPGLFPYLVLLLLLLSRLPQRRPPWLILVLGWCGGSPIGARLLRQCPQLDAPAMRRLAIATATMSPMFLLGTVPAWLHAPAAGPRILAAVLLGGLGASSLANLFPHDLPPIALPSAPEDSAPTPRAPMTFGAAVESAVRTMLMICGTMAIFRALAALCIHYLTAQPFLSLTLQTLLEVTCGIEQLAALPLPLTLRIALISAAAGFGGFSLLLQNRTILPSGLLSLPRQLILQCTHAALSFLIAMLLGG